MSSASALIEKAYQTGVLEESKHIQLVSDIDRVARHANVPIPMICQSMKDHCSDTELEYVANLRMHEKSIGLVYVGCDNAVTRMMAVAGACLRNYLNARVLSLHDVLQSLKAGQDPDGRIILIPNFCVSSESSSGVAEWQLSQLTGWLYSRADGESQTFLAVESLSLVEKTMGEMIHRFLVENFSTVTAP